MIFIKEKSDFFVKFKVIKIKFESFIYKLIS